MTCDEWTRGLFHDLLMSPLNAALPLPHVYHITQSITEHLLCGNVAQGEFKFHEYSPGFRYGVLQGSIVQ